MKPGNAMKQLDPTISVSGQIRPEEVAGLEVALIVNNRPDGEEAGQLDSRRAEELAGEVGIEYVYLPVTMQSIPGSVPTFAEVLEDHPGPVLAHCRSGTRSTILWAMAEAAHGKTPLDEIASRAAGAGYDLGPYTGVLEVLRKGRS